MLEIPLLENQYEFLTAEDRVLIEIGGRGTGKTTYCLGLWILKQCMEYPNNQLVIASSTLPQLRTATIPAIHELYDMIGVQYEYSEWKSTVHFHNGSWYRYQPLVSVPEDEIKGSNLGGLGVDEADACPESHIKKLIGGVRRPGTSQQVRLVGNSPPPNHWLEEWTLPEVAARKGKKPIGRLIQSSTYDNHFLTKGYIETCEAMWPPGSVEHRRYMLGEMGVPLEGLVYCEFEKRHVVPASSVPWSRVVGYINALDFGANHYTVFLRAAVTDDGKIFIFAEHAARRGLLKNHAEEINRILNMDPAGIGDRRPDLDPVGAVWADHDAQDRLELDALGIPTIPAVKGEKIVGINCVRQRLRDDTLFFVENTTPHTLSEIPYYVWSPTKDEPIKERDDGLDAVRYLVGGFDIDTREISF